MKSAGKARSNGLYRHIRTSKEIIRNLLNDSFKHIQKRRLRGAVSFFSGKNKIKKSAGNAAGRSGRSKLWIFIYFLCINECSLRSSSCSWTEDQC